MTIWERGCRRKRKAVYLSTFNCIFFPTIWTDILMFSFWTRSCKLCSHLWWITKRKWVEQKLGCKRSELGHSPAGCRHLSKCPFWHQNSILKHLQWCPISFRVKANILTMALSQLLLPCPSPWPHFLPLTSPLSSHQLSYLHSPTPGPLHMPSPSLECFLPTQISGAPSSSNLHVPHQMSLYQRNHALPSHINAQYFIDTSYHQAYHICIYFFI